MPADPRDLFHQAAARPSSRLDLDGIYATARSRRLIFIATTVSLVAIVLAASAIAIPKLLGDGANNEPVLPGPAPSTSPTTVTEDSNANWTTRVDWANRYALLYPAEWFAAEESLTPRLVDPKEIFTVGSFLVGYKEGIGCSNMPKSAFDAMTSKDAFLSVQERTGSGRNNNAYPHRKLFSPYEMTADSEMKIDPSSGFMCLEQDDVNVYWFPFRDSGRYFYALIAVGKDADQRTASAPWFVLNNATFFPQRPPVDEDGAFRPDHYYNAHGANVMPLVFPNGTRANLHFPLHMGLGDFHMVPMAFIKLGEDDCCALDTRFLYGTTEPLDAFAEPSGKTFTGWDGSPVELWEPKKGGDARMLVFTFGPWRLAVSLHNDRDMSEEDLARIAALLQGTVTPEGFLVLKGHEDLQIMDGDLPLSPQLNLWSLGSRQGVLLSRQPCDDAPLESSFFTITQLERSNGQVSWCQDGQIEVRVHHAGDEEFAQTAIDALRLLDITEP